MIATVTLNLALDVTYTVDEVTWHAANRVTAVAERAGGKGVNVARVLAPSAMRRWSADLPGVARARPSRPSWTPWDCERC
jgi:hypothetical protein